MKKKIIKNFIDHAYGFPIVLLNVPLIKLQGEWCLDINSRKYEHTIALILAEQPKRLTGSQVRFIRQYLDMSLKEFGERFGHVSHVAVLKWERAGDQPTNMNWSCEKDIRLAIIKKLKPRRILSSYTAFEKPISSDGTASTEKIKIDATTLKFEAA